MQYLLRRFAVMIPTIIGISIITFAAVRLIGRDPVLDQLEQSMGRGVTQEVIEEYKERRGYNKPIAVQYVMWFGKAVTGDFGTSVKDNRPVGEKLVERVPVTLLLSGLSILLIYLFAIPIGVWSAVRKDTRADRAATTALFMLYSLPNFWVATLAILLFCGGDYFDVFPAVGLSSQDAEKLAFLPWLADRVMHLVLPVFCLTYAGLAYVSRYQRAAMVEVIAQDFMRTARAKGLPERLVVFKHGLRNALIPIATLAGTLLPALFGGSVIVERIFEIPGMGRLSFEAVLTGDTDMVMAVTLVAGVTTMIGLLLTDIIYVLVDPRIALGGGRS